MEWAVALTLIGTILGVAGWINKKVRDSRNDLREEIMEHLVTIKEDIDKLEEQEHIHDRQIAKTGVVLEQLEKTLEQLTGNMGQLNTTMEQIRIELARREGKGR